MWILLTAKLPVKPSPPKLSIHWSEPWPLEKDEIQGQKKWQGNEYESDADSFADAMGFGLEHNYALSVKINFMGHDIRVWKREYNCLTPEKMRDFVFGMRGEDIPSHELIPNREADAMLLRTALETDLRGIYDAALIDGCTPEMAMAVALQVPIDEAGFEFPPVGWYRVKKEFGLYYCDEDDLEITLPFTQSELIEMGAVIH